MCILSRCSASVCFLLVCLSSSIVVQSQEKESFKSLSGILEYLIEDIVDDDSSEKILIWGENLPKDFKADKRAYIITQEMLAGDNCPKGMLSHLQSCKGNEFYRFDISLNASVLMVRIYNDCVRFEKKDSADAFNQYDISCRNSDDYIYKLNGNKWEFEEFYEANGIDCFREETIMDNNELQSLVSQYILKAVENFKQKGFKGIFLVRPNYVIPSYPWIYNNYSFNPNYLNNMRVFLPTGNERTYCYQNNLRYTADGSFYNNLLEDYQTNKLLILQPEYTLKANRLNLTIALSELTRDDADKISLTPLSKVTTKFRYCDTESPHRWKESD